MRNERHFRNHVYLDADASVPIGAWKCNFPPYFGNNDGQTDQPNNRPTESRGHAGHIVKLNFQ